jgi:ankyrin repeat protein
MMAAVFGNVEMVRTLVEAGAEVDRPFPGSLPEHFTQATPMAFAAEGGHLAVISYLLERGASLEGSPLGERSPLAIAVKAGKAEVVKLLLAKGARLDGKHGSGKDLVQLAKRRSSQREVLELLAAALRERDS